MAARSRVKATKPNWDKVGPKAIKLLLEAEWVGYPEGCCPWCGRYAPGRKPTPDLGTGHAPDCPWLALMVKAGVR